MSAFWTNVAGHQSKVWIDLALHIHVPRLHVGVVESLVNWNRRQTRRTREIKRIIKANRSAEGERYRQRRVSRGWDNDAGHGLIRLNRVCGTQGSLAIFERIPNHADSRLKILVVLVIDLIEIGTDTDQRRSCRIENNEPVIALGRRQVPVVTQSQFGSEIRPGFKIVLNKEPECALVDAARLIAERYAEWIRGAGQEGGHSREIETARTLAEIIVQELAKLAAKFKRVFSG